VTHVPEENAVTFVVQTEMQCCWNEKCGFGAEMVKMLDEPTQCVLKCVCNCKVICVLQVRNYNGIPVLFVNRYSMCTDRVLAAMYEHNALLPIVALTVMTPHTVSD
jgi:hypothetical protein